MAITGFEILSRSLDNSSSKRRYRLTGDADEVAVLAWMGANIPSFVAGLPFADFSANEDKEIVGDWDVEVNWGVPKNNGPDQPQDTLEYKFNFQAPGGHVYQSLSTVASYAHPDLENDGFGAADFGGAINVVNDKDGLRVEGYNLSPPAEVFTLSYRVQDSYISGAYQLLVESLCGKVNSSSFRGRPAGSVMLTRASGGRDTSKIWSIEFGFGYIPNDTNISVGSITVTSKDGFDLLWTYYGTLKNELSNGRTKQPTSAYVERIFQRADLNSLNLPA